MVKTSDIDIPVTLLGLFGHKNTPITVDNGTSKNRKRLRIDSPSFSRLQQKALVGYHGQSGNDYLFGFLRKTKKLWNTLVANDEKLLHFFSKLGEGDLTEEMHKEAEEFACKMYGDKRLTSVNKLRAKLFWTRLRKNDRVPDLSTLPPCSSTLRKMLRKMWKRAGVPIQSLDPFENNGWLPDGTIIDRIDQAFPTDVETLFSSTKYDEDVEMENIEDDDG